MPGRISIGVIGPTRVAVDGRDIDLSGGRCRSLLAALVASRPHGTATDGLIEMVWPAGAPATARKSVQKYVSQLRRDIAPDIVETTASGYRLGTGGAGVELAVDVDRMEHLVDEGDRRRAEHEPTAALTAYRTALDLAGDGGWYEDLAGCERIQPSIGRLTEQVAALRERYIATLTALGQSADAVAEAESLVAEHPLRESGWALLMTALYRSNRQSDALRAYRRVELALSEQLGIEPSDELRELEARILRHDLDEPDPATDALATRNDLGPPEPAAAGARLPIAYTSFVGRDREITELREVLGVSRLVTVTGPGGSGKTRLAVETATTIVGDRPVTFVDLARIADGGQVAAAFTSALGIVPEEGDPLPVTLAAGLQGRRALLVVDNCEHVLGSVAALVHHLLSNVAELSIVATSREPLGLTGEVVYALHPLSVPPADVVDGDRALAYGAVRLFVDRAQAAAPGFSLEGNAAAVVAICRRLDGIPLAIELAARQLILLDAREVERGLAEGLDHLTVPGEPVPRHRTLGAAIEWSHRLMDPAVQAFFGVLTVFPGTFTRVAARRVWALLGETADADPLLDRLVTHSMVMRTSTEGGSRYRLLEPIKEFGAERRDDRHRPWSVAHAHAIWVLELLEQFGLIQGPGEREALRRLRPEEHHLPVALAWSTAHEPELALRIAIAATPYVSMDCCFTLFDELEAAIDAGRDEAPGLRCRAIAHVGYALAENLPDHTVATVYAREALDLSRRIGDEELIMIATLTLASATRNAGQLDAAVALHEQAIARADALDLPIWAIRGRRWLAYTEMQRANYGRAIELIDGARRLGEAIGSDWVISKALWLTAALLALQGEYERAEVAAARSFELFAGFAPASPLHVRAVQGDAARLAGDHERAADIYEECLRGFREVGDQRCAASTLRNLGLVDVHLGRLDDARTRLSDALDRRTGFGDESGIAECLEGLALWSWARGDAARTLTLTTAADALRTLSGSRPPEPERRDLGRAVAEAARAVGTAAREDAVSAGRALAREPDPVAAVAGLLAST